MLGRGSTHTHNISTQEVEAGGSEFEASLQNEL